MKQQPQRARPKTMIDLGNRDVPQPYDEANKHTQDAETNSPEIGVPITSCVYLRMSDQI